jgi:serine O-acetyltransferase
VVKPRLHEQLWALSRSFHARGLVHVARGFKTLNWMIHKCLLAAEAQVGENVILEHYGLGIVIHPQVKIGSNCRIYHHVTLASETWIGSPHWIRLGNDVTIGAHSIVVARSNSDLSIGDGSCLGAGAVLTKNIPPGEIWVGNPARKLRDA